MSAVSSDDRFGQPLRGGRSNRLWAGLSLWLRGINDPLRVSDAFRNRFRAM